MDTNSVPSALREQLGPEATRGLVRLFDVAQAEWTANVVNLAVERFERRLVEEIAGVRVEIAGVRVEIARSEGRLRGEIAQQGMKFGESLAQQGGKFSEALAQQGGKFSEALAQQGGKFSEALAQQGTSLRQEMAANQFQLLKWAFLFWVGQVVAVVGLVGVMLRMS